MKPEEFIIWIEGYLNGYMEFNAFSKGGELRDVPSTRLVQQIQAEIQTVKEAKPLGWRVIR